MPVGDSITRGEYDGASAGLRKQLYQRLTAAGFSFDFVGDYGTAPYEGHFLDQRKIDDFYPENLLVWHNCDMDITGPMNTYKPNIALVFLGTNNINRQPSLKATPYAINNVIQNTKSGEMATLVNYLLKWHNGDYGTHLNYIIVSLISPTEDSTDHKTKGELIELIMEYNRLIDDFRNGTVTGHAEPVYLCDQFSFLQADPYLFSTSSSSLDPMYDNQHPKKAALYKMGDNYFDLLNFLINNQKRWFTDITWDANTAGYPDRYFAYKGVSIADISGDGRDDIYISRSSSIAPGARDYLFKNSAALPFTESAATFHISDTNPSWGMVFADIDNDGDYDLFNGNYGARNRLYKNLNNSDFEDITTTAGIANLNRSTTSVLAFDCENDGDMDLFALNSETVNEFYLNNGSGVFTQTTRGLEDVTEAGKYSMSASAADYDNDGDVDVLAVKRKTNNKLWKNNGSGSFTDGAVAAGVTLDYTKYDANGANWADFDNDGDLDLIISAMKAGSLASPLLQIFKNNGSGVLQNVSAQVNIGMSGYTVLVGDFDNDGLQDIITTNDLTYAELYLNKGNWVFQKQTDSGAEIYAGDIRGGAVFDYDNDGDLDFVVARADAFNVFMCNNLYNSNHYLRVKAFGPNNNIGGFGTKIWVYQPGHNGDNNYLLGYREVISGSGHISQYSPIQHFGLGSHSTCDVRARFTDGTENTYYSVAVDRLLIVNNISALNAPEITGASINGQKHLTLTWDAVPGATGYNVYRGATAIFVPDLAGGSNRVATAITDNDPGATGVQWVDNGVVTGNANDNHFYQVASVNNAGEGQLSQVFGEFNYDLVTTETTDFNEIALALHHNNINTANDLMNIVPNCNSVAQWDAAMQGYEQYIPGLEFTNFSVLDGYPYYINVTTGSVFTLCGTVTNPIFNFITTVTTDFNEVMLPLNKINITSAHDLMSDISSCNGVAKWKVDMQGYLQYVPGLEFTNFSTIPGYPYYVNVTESTTWPTSGLLKSINERAATAKVNLPTGAPHAVYGNIATNAGITGFSARIIGKEIDVLNQTSPGCRLQNSIFVIQTGSFKKGWKPGDKLAVEFLGSDGKVIGTTQVVLSADAFDRSTDISVNASPVPAEFRLLQNYPNPFNPETTIAFELPTDADVTLQVFNTSGQHIRTLMDGKKTAGVHKVRWDGRNDAGFTVTSGAYFMILRNGSEEKKIKTLLLR